MTLAAYAPEDFLACQSGGAPVSNLCASDRIENFRKIATTNTIKNMSILDYI